MAIFITSDWHFCHSKPFLFEPRGFDNIDDMNEDIIIKHNEIVRPNDDVYCLGDLMLNDNSSGIECIKRLEGKIHIIRGNHDSDNRIASYMLCPNIVEICDAKFLRFGKYHFFLSHFPALTSNLDEERPLQARVISLCGHSHTTDRFVDMDKGLIYHCEVDAHNNFPCEIGAIIDDIRAEITRRGDV